MPGSARPSDQLRPSAQWLSAAIGRAIDAQAGLLFVHSHPDESYPVGFSLADDIALNALAPDIAPMLDGPFAAAVVHPHGWIGSVLVNGSFQHINSITALSRTLSLLHPASTWTKDAAIDARQLDALGVVHHRLRQLVVVVVGCGGTGSPIAEQLVRMGVALVLLVDSKVLSTPSNVRRIFGSRVWDFNPDEPRPKVDIVGDYLDGIGLDTKVVRINGDVRTEDVFRILLDADVVICATDTHGSRAIVNEFASPYMLPVIDLGVRVGSKKNGNLSGLLAEVRILTPTTPCLWCRGTINADVIRAENLPDDERRKLQREGYLVRGVGEPAPSVTALTVMGSGLATSALLALLSEEGEAAPSGYWVDSFLGDSGEVGPKTRVPGCRCRQRIGLGDNAPVPFVSGALTEPHGAERAITEP
jgi:molybdopterin-synthase adenylyltransferase